MSLAVPLSRGVKVALISIGVADLAVAGLLVAVSGFLFGGGPQSLDFGGDALALFIGAVAGCLVAPYLGAWLARRSTVAGLLFAAVPLLVTAFFASGLADAVLRP